jgi:hypothetical protein
MIFRNVNYRKNAILGLLFFISLLFFLSFNGIHKLKSSVNKYFGQPKSLSSNFDEDTKEPLHVFIDLGANRGDTIYNFIGLNSEAQGGNLKNSIFPQSFKTAKWIIYGFEANSLFDNQLIKMKQDVEKLNHSVHLFKSTAAWIYDGTIDFYLDTNNKVDFWGSSLNKNHVI